MSHENISLGKNKLVIETNSGQVISWSAEGRDVLYIGSTDKRSGIPVLFPIADPLENNILNISGEEIPQHGFGRNTEWRVVSKQDNKIEIEITNEDLDEKWKTAYPWKFSCRQSFEIKDNTLIYSMQVTNNDSIEIPIAPGIHPYFNIEHSDKEKIKINNGFDGYSVDWNTEMNGFFTKFGEKNIIDLVNYKIQIIEIGYQKSFQNLVVWSQPQSAEDHNFVCIEPFTRKTNGINDDPIIVKPDTEWRSTIEFKLI